MRNSIGIILRKELKEMLRDRRMLFVVFILPVIVYPIMTVGLGGLMYHQQMKIEREVYIVAMDGDSNSSLARLLIGDAQIVVAHPDMSDSALLAGDIQAIVRIPSGMDSILAAEGHSSIAIAYDGASERSQAAMEHIRTIVTALRDSEVRSRLISKGIDTTFLKPLNIITTNLATPKRMGGYFIGRILAFLLVVMLITGAYYAAVDTIAGERERGTLETLLVAPVSRTAIILGKFVTVILVAMTVLLLNLVSLGITFSLGLSAASELQGILALSIDFKSVVLMFVLLLPLGALFSAIFIAVSAFARSYKEAQGYLSPIFLIVELPMMLVFVPGVDFTLSMAFVPILNAPFILRDALMGDLSPIYFLAAAGSTVIAAILALYASARLLMREDVLIPGGKTTIWSYLKRRRGR